MKQLETLGFNSNNVCTIERHYLPSYYAPVLCVGELLCSGPGAAPGSIGASLGSTVPLVGISNSEGAISPDFNISLPVKNIDTKNKSLWSICFPEENLPSTDPKRDCCVSATTPHFKAI